MLYEVLVSADMPVHTVIKIDSINPHEAARKAEEVARLLSPRKWKYDDGAVIAINSENTDVEIA